MPAEGSSYDLHAHSTASDGTLAPAAVVARASAQGVEVLALTDHDTTSGLGEAATAAVQRGIQLVAGVEVSALWLGTTVHIVGLGIDPDHPPLRSGLAGLRAERDRRAEAMAASLAKAGIPDALEGAAAYAAGPILSRTHFARFLVEQGHAKDTRQVFKRFLVRGRPGFVAGQWASLDEAVGWITGSGGQAVVAHPARYQLTGARLDRLLTAFRDCGGAGMEVVSGSQNADENRVMAVRAQRLGLLASVGSDFHGPENPWVELGRCDPLPPGVEPIWRNWRTSAAPTIN